MTDTALLQRVDDLTQAVAHLSRLVGARMTGPEVCARLRIHRNTLTRWIKERDFPKQTRDGHWLLADVLEWEVGQIEASEIAEYQASDPSFHLYRHFDANGRLLYVGVSLSALNRLARHKTDSHWFWSITRVEVERFATRQESLDAEQKAIKAEKPLFNIRHSTRGRK